MDYYRAFGLTDFVLCVGYGADFVRQILPAAFGVRPEAVEAGAGWHRFSTDGLRVTMVDSGPSAEKRRRLQDAKGHLGETPFLLGYADVLSDFNLHTLIKRHESGGVVVTMAATRVRSRYGELSLDALGTTVTAFVEKPWQRAPISAGYFMCAPELFEWFEAGEELEDDVLPRLAAEGALGAVAHEGLWLPLDTYKDFIDIEAIVEKEGWPWLQPI
ncbi:NDP-sugar synthase [Streptomyces sp. NPDC056004]|uniref:nucleotidyltransferase family protein n=1 Tax=unclassified Streptomyces TaxID=2593676 RepID=UPI0035D82C05